MASRVGSERSGRKPKSRIRLAEICDQSALPIWYRARLIVPILIVAYIAIGLTFRIMNLYALPAYLTGGWDWGGGNVFTYGKIFLWGALALGAIANTWAVRKLHEEPISEAIRKLLRWNALHLLGLGVCCVPLVLGTLVGGKTCRDLLLQSTFFVASGVLVLIPIITQTRRWPIWIALPLPFLLAALWGFVPLGITPPWK